MKIIQLRLENIGRVDLPFTQLETKCMALFSKEGFNKWFQGRESIWEDVQRELVDESPPAHGKVSLNAAALPSGLVAHWNFMTSSRLDFGGVLDELLGFGSFATAHRAKDRDNHIIKFSR